MGFMGSLALRPQANKKSRWLGGSVGVVLSGLLGRVNVLTKRTHYNTAYIVMLNYKRASGGSRPLAQEKECALCEGRALA